MTAIFAVMLVPRAIAAMGDAGTRDVTVNYDSVCGLAIH